MATTSPTRIDDELYASAGLVAPLMSRSTAQQITHWARIGRELEASSASARAVAEVLGGCRSYDDLDVTEQSVVRAEWAERVAERLGTLDLAAEFEAEGRSFVELDDNGEVVRRGAPDDAGSSNRG